jgi:hypothetical protein
VGGSCEHGNAYLGSIKGREHLDQQSDYQRHKMDSALSLTTETDQGNKPRILTVSVFCTLQTQFQHHYLKSMMTAILYTIKHIIALTTNRNGLLLSVQYKVQK